MQAHKELATKNIVVKNSLRWNYPNQVMRVRDNVSFSAHNTSSPCFIYLISISALIIALESFYVKLLNSLLSLEVYPYTIQV